MANRNKSYDEALAEKLKNPEYAKAYLLNIVEQEELSVDEALRETIKAMGLQNFSKKSGVSVQGVSDFVNKRKPWSTEKMTKLIDVVFNLKATLTLEDPSRGEVA